MKWHLGRYDQLRASTASRASVVLSAAAVLSAGNAVLLSQVVGGMGSSIPSWSLFVFTIAAAASAALVVLSLMRASDVLVTPRRSRIMFQRYGNVPPSFVFNGTDTVAQYPVFEDFRNALASQGQHAALEAAEVELWMVIHQHRYRYVKLRGAVRLLRYAAIAFLVILSASVLLNLIDRF